MKKIMKKIERFLNKIRESGMDKREGMQSVARLLKAITNMPAIHTTLDNMSTIKKVVLLAELRTECTHLENIFSAPDPKSELLSRLKQRNKTINLEPDVIPYSDLPSSPANVLYFGLLLLFFPHLTANECQQLLLPDVAYFIDYEMYLEPGKKRTIVLEKKPINLLPISSIEAFSQMVVCGDLAVPITTVLLTDLRELKQLYNLLQAHYPQLIPKIFKRNQALILLQQELESYVDFGRSMRQVLATLRDEFILASVMLEGNLYVPDRIVKPLLKLLDQFKNDLVDKNSYDQILQLPYGKGEQSKFAKIDQRIERGKCIDSTAQKIQEFLNCYPSQHPLLDKQQQRIYTNIQELSFSTDERTEITINWQNIKNHIQVDLENSGLQFLLSILPLDDYPSFFQLLATAPDFDYLPSVVSVINENKLNKLANECVSRHCYLLGQEESFSYRIEKMVEIDNPNFLRFFIEHKRGEEGVKFQEKIISAFRKLLKSNIKISEEKVKILLDCLTDVQKSLFIYDNFKGFFQQNCFQFLIDNYQNIFLMFSGIKLHKFMKKIAVFRDLLPVFMKIIIAPEKWNDYFYKTEHAIFFSPQSFESFQFIYENTGRDQFVNHLQTLLTYSFSNIKHLFKDIRTLMVMNEFLNDNKWNDILDPTNYFIKKIVIRLAIKGNKAFEFIADKIKNAPAFKEFLLHTMNNNDCILSIAARKGLNVMPLVDVLEEDKLFPKLVNSSANSLMSYQASAPIAFCYLQKKLSRQHFIAWLAKDYWASQQLFANRECKSIVAAYFTEQDYTDYYQIVGNDFCYSILANLNEEVLLQVLQGLGANLRQRLISKLENFYQKHISLWAKYSVVFAFILKQLGVDKSFLAQQELIAKLIACPESFSLYVKYISSTQYGEKFYALVCPQAAKLYKYPDNFLMFFKEQKPLYQFWMIKKLQGKIDANDYLQLASYAYKSEKPEEFYQALNAENIRDLPLAYLECIFKLCSAPFFSWIKSHRCRMKALFTRSEAFEVFHNALLKYPEISENYYAMRIGKTLIPLIALLRNYPKAYTIFLKTNPQYPLLIDRFFMSTILHDYKNLPEDIRSCLKNHWQALQWEKHLAAKNSEGRTPLHLATLDAPTFLFYWQRLLPQAQHSYLFHIDNSGNSVAHYLALRQELCMQVQALLPPEVWQKLLVLKNKEGLTVADFLSLADSSCYRQALEKIMRSNRLDELRYFCLPKNVIEEIMRTLHAEYNINYESFDESSRSVVYRFFLTAEKQTEAYISECHKKLSAILPLWQAGSLDGEAKKECDKLGNVPEVFLDSI